jgi:NADH-quinone oxidoreductase subunit E
MAGLVPAIPIRDAAPCHPKRDARDKRRHDNAEKGRTMSVRRLAPPEVQPKDFAFSKANLAWAEKQIAKYPEGRQASAIISLLWRAQEQAGGWLPEAAIRHVADFLGMPHIRALEVATFYTMFNLTPVGKFHVQLCGTTPCRLRGADDLEKVCRKRIGDQMEVTRDGMFSWVEVECLGACVNAPMAQINADYYEDLTAKSFGKILDQLAAGKKVKPGPQVDRQLSAPVGGPITLTDTSIYQRSGNGGRADEPKDANAKKPGAAANWQSGVPKPPAQDKQKPKPN